MRCIRKRKNEGDNMDQSEELYLPEMFPRKVILFSTRPFSKAQVIPYRFAHAYLRASEGTDKKLIWITTEQTAEKVPEIFEEYGYDIEKYKERIICIDIVSKGAGIRIGDNSYKIIYIENPNNLIDIAMTFSDIFSDTMCELAVIDTINGFLAFNSLGSVVKFIRFLPSIAYRTSTTLMLNFLKGEYGEDVESAVQICADASMVADDNYLTIKTRSGSEKIALSL
ncbi:MAG: ATPase domain-containing protein [Candidatus Micrarchaeia archaeon]